MMTNHLENLNQILERMRGAPASDYQKLFDQLSLAQLNIFRYLNKAKHSSRNAYIFQQNVRTAHERLKEIEPLAKELQEPYRKLMVTCIEQLETCLWAEFGPRPNALIS